MIGLIGRKLGMEQIFAPDGKLIPVTAIEVGPCPITQVKTKDHDGYNAIQLGFGKVRKMNKPMVGKLKKANVATVGKLIEIRVSDPAAYKIGNVLDISIFKEGDIVQVIGYTKGRGFAGGVKRWGWGGGPAAHGLSLIHI